MSLTIREQVAAAFAERIGAARCNRDAPITCWDDSSTEFSYEYNQTTATIKMRIEAKAAAENETDVSSAANALEGEIERKIMNPDRRLGGLCSDMRITSSTRTWPEAGNMLLVGLEILVDIIYQYERTDPYKSSLP